MVAQEVREGFTQTQKGASFQKSLLKKTSLQKAVTGEAGSHVHDITRVPESSGPASLVWFLFFSVSPSFLVSLSVFLLVEKRSSAALPGTCGGWGVDVERLCPGREGCSLMECFGSPES